MRTSKFQSQIFRDFRHIYLSITLYGILCSYSLPKLFPSLGKYQEYLWSTAKIKGSYHYTLYSKNYIIFSSGLYFLSVQGYILRADSNQNLFIITSKKDKCIFCVIQQKHIFSFIMHFKSVRENYVVHQCFSSQSQFSRLR